MKKMIKIQMCILHSPLGRSYIDIDSVYERKLVNFARDGPSPCISRGPGHRTGAPSVYDQVHFRVRNITINTITINTTQKLTFLLR